MVLPKKPRKEFATERRSLLDEVLRGKLEKPTGSSVTPDPVKAARLRKFLRRK